MSDFLSLYFTFFKVGLFTFGGGYAMLPIIEHEVVEKKGWITSDELLQYFSISQCTPGVIAVNTSTFVGSKKRGALGALAATLGVITPSIIIIVLFASVLQRLDQYPAVGHAFEGIRPAVAALIITTCIKISKKSIKSICDITLFILSFILITFFNFSPILIVILASLCGLLLFRKNGVKHE